MTQSGEPLDEAKQPRRAHGSTIVSARVLSRLRSIAEVLFSRGGRTTDEARVDWVMENMEDYLARSGKLARWMLTISVYAVVLAAPFFIGSFRRFANLSLNDRVRALGTLERKFGEPLLPVKALLCMVYYEHPGAAAEVGFDGACRVPPTAHRPVES